MSAPSYYTQPAEAVLGDSVICDRCGATMASYDDACSARLDDPCPGFLAIENALALSPPVREAASDKIGGAEDTQAEVVRPVPCEQSVRSHEFAIHGMTWCLYSGRYCDHATMGTCRGGHRAALQGEGSTS